MRFMLTITNCQLHKMVIIFKWSNIINYVQSTVTIDIIKVKVRVLRPIQQPGSYWRRPSALSLVGVKPLQK